MALFFFASSSIFNISTTARVWVGLEWAKTENMQRQLSGMLGACLSLLGSFVIQRWLLGASWRKIIFVTGVSTTLLDAIPQFCTIFDVLRNLGSPVVPFCPFYLGGLLILKPNIRKKGTLIIKGLLGNLGTSISILVSQSRRTCPRQCQHSSPRS